MGAACQWSESGAFSPYTCLVRAPVMHCIVDKVELTCNLICNDTLGSGAHSLSPAPALNPEVTMITTCLSLSPQAYTSCAACRQSFRQQQEGCCCRQRKEMGAHWKGHPHSQGLADSWGKHVVPLFHSFH